ncbi:hypothetical protein EZMO1_0938 [Endozoicomonas montiporae CL-33]|nr:hypothetical protein [Endozoicomonas montiporae]AMO55153.1 hypothetical protein EZMO1_0938 [Endozoicomonas montiporae CL-33]
MSNSISNKCILILVLLFSSMTLTVEAKVVALVFHNSYCQSIPEVLESYKAAVRKKGYDVVDLCVSTMSDYELKRSIEVEAEKKTIRWTDIEGVNIVGSVVNTVLDTSLSKNIKQPLPSVSRLVFDDFRFSYNNTLLTGVESGFFMPSRVRWVSQLFANNPPLKQVVEGLSEAEDHLAAPEEVSCGRRFSDELLTWLNRRKVRMTDNWSSFPDGLGWNLMVYVSTVSLWYITGESRVAEGYSRTNRQQTTCDKVMYSIFIYPAFAIFNMHSTYHLANHVFGSSLPNDQSGWKRYVLNKRLLVDGLAKQLFCPENFLMKAQKKPSSSQWKRDYHAL